MTTLLIFMALCLAAASSSPVSLNHRSKRSAALSWRDIEGGCIKNFNNKVITAVTSMDMCKQLCLAEVTFTCMSIDYNAGLKTCHLSEKYSGNNPLSVPCYVGTQWSYAEINNGQVPIEEGPSDTWKDYQGSCVWMNNNRIIKNVPTMDECKKLCEAATDFTCWSIDYWVAPKHQCQLSDKYSGNYDVSTPCHVAEVDYAERLPLQVQECSDTEVDFRGNCYEFVTENKAYTDATAYCADNGGHLVDILSAEENAFIGEELEQLHEVNKEPYWYIGLRSDNNIYPVWDSGKSVDYDNWGKGEPERASEQCVTIERQEGYKWHDIGCTRKEPFICKSSGGAAAPSPSTPRPDIKQTNPTDAPEDNSDGNTPTTPGEESGLYCIKCESWQFKYKDCSVESPNTQYYVYMAKQHSKTTCKRGINWGLNNLGLWVDKGCRGDFCFDGPGTIDIAADDAYDLYVDGKLIGSASNWRQSERYEIRNPDQVQVLAVKGRDLHKVVSGIILTFRYGDEVINTDSHWKCIFDIEDISWNQPGYDDSNWPSAVEFSTNRDDSYVKLNNGNPWWPKIDQAAKMIWTSNNYRDATIYCRRNIGSAEDVPEAGDSNGSTEQITELPTQSTNEESNDADKPSETGDYCIKCESWQFKYKDCSIEPPYTQYYVYMEKQHSKTTCKKGLNWGLNDEGLWVDKGCRGDFCFVGPGTIDVAADDAYELYVDGNVIGSSSNWRHSERYDINNPDQVQVIAVKGRDLYKVVSGIILTFRYGDALINTDSQWKCIFDTVDSSWNQPGFDDSAWPNAVEVSTNRDDSYVKLNKGNPWWPNIDQAAKMIWTSNSYRDATIYCRRNIKPDAPKQDTTPPIKSPEDKSECQYIGQYMRDTETSCKFYQCAYADNDANLYAVSHSCAPGTSVLSDYKGDTNPCVGPPLPECP